MKKILTTLLALALMMMGSAALAADVWDGTADTSWYVNNPSANEYTLNTAEELAGLAELVNGGTAINGKTITLGTDIDLANKEWTPIGNGANYFESNTFDGNGHTVSNLYINKPNDWYIGLFGFASNSSFKNLTIHNVDLKGLHAVSALCGQPYTGSEISNITVSGLIKVEASWYVGLIGGYNCYVTTVQNCKVVADEGSYISSSGAYVAGIVGFRAEGDHVTKNCTVENLEISAAARVGGVLGIAHYGNTVEECEVADTTVASTDSDENTVGMIVGANNGTESQPTMVINNKSDDNVSVSIAGEPYYGQSGATTSTGSKPASTVGMDVVTDESGKYVAGSFEMIPEGKISSEVVAAKSSEGILSLGKESVEKAVANANSGTRFEITQSGASDEKLNLTTNAGVTVENKAGADVTVNGDEVKEGEATVTPVEMTYGDKKTEAYKDDLVFSGKDLSLRSTATFTDKSHAKLKRMSDGKMIDMVKDKDYLVTEGSIVVTLKDEFLNTLEAGQYELSIMHTEKEGVSGLFTIPVPASIEVPQTGDNSSLMLWTLLLGMSALCFAAAKKVRA